MTLLREYYPAHSCIGYSQPGAKMLMAWYLTNYAHLGGTNLGIYVCKTIGTSRSFSVHAEGRAADLGHPVGAGWVPELGEQLRLNSAELGIQCVISNRHIWSGAYPDAGWRPYSGSDPHTGHMHVELTPGSAKSLTMGTITAVLHGATADTGDDIVSALPELQQGSTGYSVKVVQAVLNANGATLDVDGDFGPLTSSAVRAFQTSHAVAGGPDGIVGDHTWRALLGV